MAATERGGKNRGKQKNDTETLILGRMPPQNIEAEMAVLGAMLLDKDAIEVAENMLHPEDFYREQDAIIYQAVLNLSRAGKSADILTVTEELRRMGRLDDVGGIMYVNELPEHVITTKGIERHVDIVSGKAKLRRLIDTAGDIAEAAYTEENTVEEIVDDAERAILQVAREQNVKGFTPVGEAVQHTLEDITRKYQNHELITGLATGFAKLDAFTNGFQKGNLIIVAARPSMGKTAIVLNMAKNMSLSSAVSVFMEAPLYIDDTPAVTVAQIRARCRRLKAEHGLDAVMIDYLQLMTSRNVRNNDSRQQEISEISRSLKSLARELEVPVIALSQLSRGPDARPNHRPLLSDLRESGSIEQDADLVCFLYREAYYNKEIEEGDPRQNETELILAKNRNGPVGIIKMFFAGQYTLFYEATNQEAPPDVE